jgi:histidinol phosphatase-like enzyme
MFNAKKKRIKELEKTVADLNGILERQKRENKTTYECLEFERAETEMAKYKLGLVEQLMKQLTININMNGKKK